MEKQMKELTPKEFLKLPIEERQKLLVEQSNDPEIVAYYREVCQLSSPKGEKPPVLSKEVYESIVMGYGNKAYADILPVLEAQRDADLPYIEQARQEASQETLVAIEEFMADEALELWITGYDRGDSLKASRWVSKDVLQQVLKNKKGLK